MQKLTLSQKTKNQIMRRVWLTWAYRKAAPLAVLVLVALIESAFVSFSSVASNTVGAAQNMQALSTYVFLAVVNAKLYALVGAAVLLAGGVVFIRGIFRDLKFFGSSSTQKVYY